jgi:hypothetical protein
MLCLVQVSQHAIRMTKSTDPTHAPAIMCAYALQQCACVEDPAGKPALHVTRQAAGPVSSDSKAREGSRARWGYGGADRGQHCWGLWGAQLQDAVPYVHVPHLRHPTGSSV